MNHYIEKYSIDVSSAKRKHVIKSTALCQFVAEECVSTIYTIPGGNGLQIGDKQAVFATSTPQERKSSAFASNPIGNEHIFINTILDLASSRIFWQIEVKPDVLNEYIITPNKCLHKPIRAFYHTDYYKYGEPNNPDYINILKNEGDVTPTELHDAAMKVKEILTLTIPQIKKIINTPFLTIVLIPRAKANQDDWYQHLRTAVSQWVDDNINDGYIDGCHYIVRETDSPTTHRREGRIEPGTILKTCSIDPEIEGKNILLIDDIYTFGANVDEDALQAVLDNKPESVTFYSIAKTIKE